MSGFDYIPGTITPQIEVTCAEIKERLMMIVGVAEPTLQQVRNMVRGQRSDVIAEMGVDNATALLVVYTKLKEAVEAAKGVTIEEMPEA